MKKIIFCLSLLFTTLVSFTSLAEEEQQIFSDAELAQMLAPIALYPDSLLTHILIASTYPIEIVEAHRWAKKNEKLNTEQKKKLLEDFDWDASVKALIPFDHVLTRLSEELSWTQSLGDAFLQDESRLLLSIQTLRKKAKLAGSLNKMDNMDIGYEEQNISITSRKKEVVYVPYYDTRIVYGSWLWSAYPPVFWHPNHNLSINYYHPFSWHNGVHITFNYFFSAFHWSKRHVVVVNPRRAHHRYYHQHPRRLIADGGYAKRWSHRPSHRKGVAYRTKRTSDKYYGKRASTQRINKKLNNRHSKVKQRLYASNHIQHKVKGKVRHVDNRKGVHKGSPMKKRDIVKSGQASESRVLHHKKQGDVTQQYQQKQKKGYHKANVNKRNEPSGRQSHHRANKVAKRADTYHNRHHSRNAQKRD